MYVMQLFSFFFLLEADKGDRTSKQSDQTSNNDSDLKVEIRTASSLSNPPESEQWDDSSERITPRAVITNGDPLYGRYGATGIGMVGLGAGDYTDATAYPIPPKTEGHNNNGYVPYVDYGRDYNPAFGKFQLKPELDRLDRFLSSSFSNLKSFCLMSHNRRRSLKQPGFSLRKQCTHGHPNDRHRPSFLSRLR